MSTISIQSIKRQIDNKSQTLQRSALKANVLSNTKALLGNIGDETKQTLKGITVDIQNKLNQNKLEDNDFENYANQLKGSFISQGSYGNPITKLQIYELLSNIVIMATHNTKSETKKQQLLEILLNLCNKSQRLCLVIKLILVINLSLLS